MKSTAKTVGLVMIIMVLSRSLSLLSVIVYTAFFGTNNTEINIYSWAINIPNIIFTCLGTALATVVIPIFAGYIGRGEKERAFKFADNLICLSTISILFLSILGILISPFISYFTEYRGNPFAVMALRIMFPVMLFYGLNYILQGILQSMGRFNMPAFVSVPSSLIVILYVFVLGKKFGVTGLLVATFIGLSTQALILIPPVFKTEYRFKPSFDYKSPDIKNAVRLSIPVLIGTSAYQINMLFNVTLSANFGNKVTLLYLSQQLVLYSMLAFIYSVTAVLYPKLTVFAARNEIQEYKNSLEKVLRSVLYFLVPATAGFIAVRFQLLDLLTRWGKVTHEDVKLAGSMLAFYAVGIVGIGMKEVLDRGFYSLKDTKTPAINGVVIMLVNISFSLLLTRFFGILGIPMAYSLSALTGGIVLIVMLWRKIGYFGGTSFVLYLFKLVATSAVMFTVVQVSIYLVNIFVLGFGFVDRVARLFIPVSVGVAVYFAMTYILRVDESVAVLEKVRAHVRLKV